MFVGMRVKMSTEVPKHFSQVWSPFGSKGLVYERSTIRECRNTCADSGSRIESHNEFGSSVESQKISKSGGPCHILSIYLFIYPSIYLSICLSMCVPPQTSVDGICQTLSDEVIIAGQQLVRRSTFMSYDRLSCLWTRPRMGRCRRIAHEQHMPKSSAVGGLNMEDGHSG